MYPLIKPVNVRAPFKDKMMKRLGYQVLSSALLLAAIFLETSPSAAQSRGAARSRPSQFGSIDLEQDKVSLDPYMVSQDAALALFKSMEGIAKQLSQAGTTSSLAVSDDVVNYLTGVYLYCSIRNGTCPVVLEALFEIEVINARSSGKSECSVLPRFWKIWVKNDMEKRQEYSIATGFLDASQKFKDEVRPKYVRCNESLGQELGGAGNITSFFKDRYREGTRAAALPGKMVALIELLKAKVPNVFYATGAMKPPSEK